MSLHDTDAQEIETTGAAESLPDPTLVNGRTHELTNTGTVTAIWSSIGATPFTEGGVNVTTISVPRGDSKQFQSDGVHWVAKSKAGSRPFYAATGVTDGAGLVTFTFPVGMFTAAPVVDLAFQGAASANPVDFRITAVSAASVTVAVRQSLATVIALLGLTLLAASLPLAGATIHCMATPVGSTP